MCLPSSHSPTPSLGQGCCFSLIPPTPGAAEISLRPLQVPCDPKLKHLLTQPGGGTPSPWQGFEPAGCPGFALCWPRLWHYDLRLNKSHFSLIDPKSLPLFSLVGSGLAPSDPLLINSSSGGSRGDVGWGRGRLGDDISQVITGHSLTNMSGPAVSVSDGEQNVSSIFFFL